MTVDARQPSAFTKSFLERFDGTTPAESGWLRELRASARDRFAELGLPHGKIEAWRHTPLRDLADDVFVSASSDAKPDVRGGTLDLDASPSIELRFVDGVLSTTGESNLPAGITVENISTNASAKFELGKIAAFDSDSVTALNTAGFGDGCLIRLSAAAQHDELLHLKFLQSGRSSVLPRVLILAEAGSMATVIEEHAGTGRYLSVSVVEMHLERDAKLQHVQLQHESSDSRHIHRLAARLESGASLRSDSIVLDGGLIRNQIDVELTGEESFCQLGGLVVAAGKQIVDHHTTIRHLAPNTKSVERFRHVLDERARGVFCGLVHVAEDAQHTDAEQSNRNLLLSDDAQMNTMPQLEIYADEVRCTHGATLGQLDQDALFYLRARGIDSETARTMLVHAFVGEIVDDLPQPALRDWVRQALARRLPGEVPLLEIA